ncbi:hypothetical protein AX774_g2766 [Zancudomyces culisetae]|uniref:Uncharacterized protein n=1 Tax=Zancudomyces culisetae TaxID=1213189 RepID=A0A1R1PRV9_ZANCU|nr:hypothetical protein AX774_g2766 [Zancudomyces culisetae]|eukprot:OMH83720.1 hypothetical protein AX774_g2766 [Zancudomyces culisetae]
MDHLNLPDKYPLFACFLNWSSYPFAALSWSLAQNCPARCLLASPSEVMHYVFYTTTFATIEIYLFCYISSMFIGINDILSNCLGNYLGYCGCCAGE